MAIITHLARFILPTLAITAVLSTYLLAYNNGYLSMLFSAISAPNATIPDLNLPLKTNYTGIHELDKVFAQFVVVFSAIVGGTRPEATLQGVHFLGQGLAIWVLVCVEGYRVGNAWKAISL